jgi:hypothetical protein
MNNVTSPRCGFAVAARIPIAANSSSTASCAIWKGGSDCVGAMAISAGTRLNTWTTSTKTLK